jgi:hypothetical protein
VNRAGSWTDPLIGGRYHRELGNGFALTAYGDVGGFGVGAHTDWQVLGTVVYSLSPSWNLHLGYRSLNFNITGSEGRFGFNVHMRGRPLPAHSVSNLQLMKGEANDDDQCANPVQGCSFGGCACHDRLLRSEYANRAEHCGAAALG